MMRMKGINTSTYAKKSFAPLLSSILQLFLRWFSVPLQVISPSCFNLCSSSEMNIWAPIPTEPMRTKSAMRPMIVAIARMHPIIIRMIPSTAIEPPSITNANPIPIKKITMKITILITSLIIC
jgi:hypothetical protein